MRLSQLLSIFSELKWGDDPHREVTSLTQDSRQLSHGCVYVAVKGVDQDGHRFLADVCRRGAAAVVVEDESEIPLDFRGAVVRVSDSRTALNLLAARFFGHSAQRLFCVGVTGTNGKTTITHMVESVLNAFGWPTGVMGTINHHLGERIWESELTTPGPVVLHQRIREFEALGARAVAFEVSSHALAQKRVDQIPFDALVFSNLTRDHLDYHRTFEEYFSAKERLFSEVPLGDNTKATRAIINTHDPWGRRIHVADRVRVWTYGAENADFRFMVQRAGFSGTEFTLTTPRGSTRAFVPLPGIYNVYNAVAAIAVGLSAGASLDVCVNAISDFVGVSGRLERVPNDKGIHIFVDYAHTDDALASVLRNLAQIRQSGETSERIITVFGCGGDRDRGKRPLMAKAALAYSDMVIVTSDNPRSEDPEKIIDDILAGVDGGRAHPKVLVKPDRREAISTAIQKSAPGDVVLIAGKGHEKFQIIGSKKIPFDDVAVAKETL